MRKNLNLRANIALGLIFAFLINTLGPLPLAQAQEFVLPAPGQMVGLSPFYSPAVLKGIKLDPKNPFRFHFFVDRGDGKLNQEDLKNESSKLIKYFLASLTIPEKDLWVNLSPYEKNRIVPQDFGQTDMGRDLLAEDYILKQITASLIYPESKLGKEFWQKVYAQAQAKYGTTNIPINTFNKVWIIPEKAVVYENKGVAFVLENHLKVMLEQDYLSLSKHVSLPGGEVISKRIINNDVNAIGSQIVREIVIPALTQEVNEGKNFSQLRQVFYSLILATWYKKKIKDGLLNKIYSNRKKVKNLSSQNALIGDPEHIYQQYLQAFKKGVYNYIKEEPDQATNQNIPRKYFSGGVVGDLHAIEIQSMAMMTPKDRATLSASALTEIVGDMNINPNNAPANKKPDADAPKSQINFYPDGRVAIISWPEGSAIKKARISYDKWGQIDELILVKGTHNGASPKAVVSIAPNIQFNFTYENGVPNIWVIQDNKKWYFSGYKLIEINQNGFKELSYVTIKNFGSRYPALESDSHIDMYYFLMLLKNKNRNLRLVNIDLHHDVYENILATIRSADDKNINYTNWVLRAWESGYILGTTWVYPPWYVLPDKIKKAAQKEGAIDQITANLFEIDPNQPKVITIDFDAISSSDEPQVHIAAKDEIDQRVAELTNFIKENKGSLAGINLNRSAFSREYSHNYAPQESSTYILNALISSTAEILGDPQLTKIRNPFSMFKTLLEVHPGLYEPTTEERFIDEIEQVKRSLINEIALLSWRIFSSAKRARKIGYLIPESIYTPQRVQEIIDKGINYFKWNNLFYLGNDNLGLIMRFNDDWPPSKLEAIKKDIENMAMNSSSVLVTANSIEGTSDISIMVDDQEIGYLQIGKKGETITDAGASYCNYCILYNPQKKIGAIFHLEGGSKDQETIEKALINVFDQLGGKEGFKAIIAYYDSENSPQHFAWHIHHGLVGSLIKLGVPIEKDDHQQAWYNERVYFNIASKTFYSKERQLSFTDQAIVTQEKTTDGPMRTMPARALISRSFRRGGIDLNPAQMSMQVKTVGEDFKFDFNGTEIDAAQVTGVTFTIRQMTPVTDLPQILGLTRHSSI